MRLFVIIKHIINHPFNRDHKFKAVIRFITWQLRTLYNLKPFIHKFTNKSKIYLTKGMAGATCNLYNGLHEYSEMLFLLHFLRKEDKFIDIGANVGSYTILAAGHVGAQTISFEPVPQTFQWLNKNIHLNKIEFIVQSFNMALGSEKGSLNFSSNEDAMNHVVNEGGIKVPVDTLDNITQNFQPTMIKIDVEGWETEVIKGAENTLKMDSLKVIIIELFGLGNNYGFDEKKVDSQLKELGFRSYQYDPEYKSLLEVNQSSLYIRDIDFVRGRLKDAIPVFVQGEKL